MDHIYRALKPWGKYPLLATDTQVNSDLCWYQNSEITAQKEDFNSFIPYYYNNFKRKSLVSCLEVNSKGYSEFE